jgi:hypothetical protein
MDSTATLATTTKNSSMLFRPMRLLFTGDDTWTAVATTPHKKSDLAHASKCERKVGGHAGGGVPVADLKYDDELEGEQLNVFLQLVCSCQTVH